MHSVLIPGLESGHDEPYKHTQTMNMEMSQRPKSHMDIQSYNMFTVLKYAINEILCVSV